MALKLTVIAAANFTFVFVDSLLLVRNQFNDTASPRETLYDNKTKDVFN